MKMDCMGTRTVMYVHRKPQMAMLLKIKMPQQVFLFISSCKVEKSTRKLLK